MVIRIEQFTRANQARPPLHRVGIGRKGMANPDDIVLRFIQPAMGMVSDGQIGEESAQFERKGFFCGERFQKGKDAMIFGRQR
jgi:hypothetical protein